MSNDKYIHSDVEDKIYSYWEKNNLFKPTTNKKKFSVVIPPPNVTGSLLRKWLIQRMQPIEARLN